MTTIVLRYKAKPERAEENQQLIEAVFAELDEGELDGFTYKVFRLEDGVSFIHVWIEHDIADPDSLQVVPAFQAFMADLQTAATSHWQRRKQPSLAAPLTY